MPNGVCGAGYMLLLSVLGLCTWIEICSRGRYSCSGVCFGVCMLSTLLSVCVGGISVIIDVLYVLIT